MNKAKKYNKFEQSNLIIEPPCFLDYISCPSNFYNILKAEKDITLALNIDYDKLQSWLNISNGLIEYNILTPQIPIPIISNIHIAHKTAATQRIIDSWFDALKETIKYAAYNCNKKIIINIKNTCIYSRYMFWKEYDPKCEITYYVAHNYIRAHHPDAYIKEKEFFDSLHWIEKPYVFANKTANHQ